MPNLNFKLQQEQRASIMRFITYKYNNLSANPPVAPLLFIVGESLEFHHRIFMIEAVGW